MTVKAVPFRFSTRPLWGIPALTNLFFLLFYDYARLFLAMIFMYFSGGLSIPLPQFRMDPSRSLLAHLPMS